MRSELDFWDTYIFQMRCSPPLVDMPPGAMDLPQIL